MIAKDIKIPMFIMFIFVFKFLLFLCKGAKTNKSTEIYNCVNRYK